MKILFLFTILGCVCLSQQLVAIPGNTNPVPDFVRPQPKTCVAEPKQETSNIKANWIRMDDRDECATEISKHITNELTAAITYLELSAYFSSELYFRPGLSHFFLESASEERGHAKQFMEYLLMRGGSYSQVKTAITSDIDRSKKINYLGALTQAFNLEHKVTESIRAVTAKCEEYDKQGNGLDDRKFNDFLTVDYLTGEFLAEQHTSLRTIAGYIASLEKMSAGNAGSANANKLQEILFDQTLIKD